MAHLTHGWEPDLDPSDSLLRRFVLATADRSESMAQLVGGRYTRTDAYSASDPRSVVFFDNSAVLLQPLDYVDLTSTVRSIVDFYPADRHFVLLSAFPTPDLSPFGLELMGHPPFMCRSAGGTAPPLPDGLEIREVSDAADLTVFVNTLVEAYPIPGGQGAGLADAAMLRQSIRLFVGFVDGVPAGTSGAWIGHGVNDVEWVSTRDDYRRRGIGAALTWAATLADPALPAVLIASDDGQGVYEAMGYVRLLRVTLWHRPPG